jgi:hypothetical protein
MRIDKMMLIGESVSRNLTPAKETPLAYSLQFELNNSTGKPWPIQLEYSFKADVGEGDEAESLCECSGSYALDVEFDDEETISSPSVSELVWPFLRADIITLLSSVKLPLNIPYSLGELTARQEGANASESGNRATN